MISPQLRPEQLTLLPAGAGPGPGMQAARGSACVYFPALK